MNQRVAILGGGVAGMSAAHELIKRGFEVDVYEARGVDGGKARSFGVLGSGTCSRPDLPAEHGFRFFPGFYKHLPATMQEIQVGAVSAFDHLVPTSGTLLVRSGGKQSIFTPNTFPTSPGALIQAFESFTLFYCDLGVPKREVAHFIRCLLKMLVSCDERRFQDYEKKSWYEFIDAANMSQAYQDYFAKGLSRSLVALNAKELSARTGGCILLQFLIDFTEFIPLDRVLDRPTSDVWITPWYKQLDGDGVKFHLNSSVESFQMCGGRICSVSVNTNGAVQDIKADFYIAALPVDKIQPKITPDMIAADPGLASISQLKFSWMTGILFYLKRDVPIVRGHVNYLNSAWALTSISQAQFWSGVDLSDYGDGTVHGIISVIISNWDDPLFGTGPAAKDCTEDQVKQLVWAQLKDHLNPPGGPTVLSDTDLERVVLAPCMTHYSTPTPHWIDDEPLSINTINSWSNRPNAVTGIDNLYLASDYVRTNTDLATMEAANEAARRAVNGILDCINSPQPRCEIWPMDEPWLLAGYRVMDEVRFSLGLPPLVPPIPAPPWPCPHSGPVHTGPPSPVAH